MYRVGRRTVRILRRDIRKVPGTAHRPFPTVSLEGGTIQPHGLYTERCLAMNHRRYIAWYHSTIQVIYAAWRAAGCRPYIENVLYYRVLNTFDVLLPNKNGGTSVPPKIVNCQLSIVNWKKTVNCQL